MPAVRVQVLIMAEFSYKWNLSKLVQDKKHVKVLSCFSCGGGSTMGYKRAGFDVIGNVEIDPKINAMYVKNHHPKFNYCMDLREFNKLRDIPEELFNLDILDGSPPCSTFSMAGLREQAWNKEKAFREGQKFQRLDDLFFVFLETVAKLKPKIVIAENVMGMIKGNAKGYVNEVITGFKNIGYQVQLFRLDAAFMDVPSKRERIFFIATNQAHKPLVLNFNRPPIYFVEVRSKNGVEVNSASRTGKLLKHRQPTDHNLADINKRLYGRNSSFNDAIVQDNRICSTIASSGMLFRMFDGKRFSDSDFINCQTFPQDYDFAGMNVQYVCGMSVPPNMMAHIAIEIYNQWLR